VTLLHLVSSITDSRDGVPAGCQAAYVYKVKQLTRTAATSVKRCLVTLASNKAVSTVNLYLAFECNVKATNSCNNGAFRPIGGLVELRGRRLRYLTS
jgi:hypothetical protein